VKAGGGLVRGRTLQKNKGENGKTVEGKKNTARKKLSFKEGKSLRRGEQTETPPNPKLCYRGGWKEKRRKGGHSKMEKEEFCEERGDTRNWGGE